MKKIMRRLKRKIPKNMLNQSAPKSELGIHCAVPSANGGGKRNEIISAEKKTIVKNKILKITKRLCLRSKTTRLSFRYRRMILSIL